MQSKSNNKNTYPGYYIQLERKKAGITQLELGKRVGLSRQMISQIENGKDITNEVASFILKKIGSQIRYEEKYDSELNNSLSSFMMPVIYRYSREKKIPLDRAYKYLKRFKGLDHLRKYRNIEQGKSREEILKHITQVCAKNGGGL